MSRLRHATFLARLVLAWFVLSLGVAIASPLVKPQAMELICSSAGSVKLMVKADEGVKAQAGHTLDCPLCAAAGAPPPLALLPAAYASPLGLAAQSIPSARIAALTASPPPSRAPPASLLI